MVSEGGGGGKRDGADFFLAPELSPQRQYEALRAFFVDGRRAAEIAGKFGYQGSTPVFDDPRLQGRAG